MKRLALIAASSVLALMLTACGEEKKPEGDKPAVQVNVEGDKAVEQASPATPAAPAADQDQQTTEPKSE